MEAPRADDVNPDAPYGYLKDGVTPKKGPGGRPSKKAGARSTRPGNRNDAAAPPPPPRRSSTARPRSGTDYRPGLTGFLHVLAAPLTMQRKSPALQLDGMALLMIGEEMAEGFNTLAQTRPEVAAACEKLIAVGPYGAILQPFARFGAQVAANHGWLPPQVTRALGAVSPEELQAMVVAQAQRAEEAQRQAAAYVAHATAEEPPEAAGTVHDFPQRIDLSDTAYAESGY
jgi:hypothetical protein